MLPRQHALVFCDIDHVNWAAHDGYMVFAVSLQGDGGNYGHLPEIAPSADDAGDGWATGALPLDPAIF